MKKNLTAICFFLIFIFIPLLVHADFVTLYPSDFVPNGDNDPFGQSASSIWVKPGASANQYFHAPLHLPDDATITGMTIFYYDYSTENLYVWIGRELLYDIWQVVYHIVDWNSSGAVDAFRNSKTTSVSWAHNRVVNSGAMYHVQLAFPSGGDSQNLQFICIKVWYKNT